MASQANTPAYQTPLSLTAGGGLSTSVPVGNIVTEEAAATLPYASTATPQQWVASLYTNLLAAAGTSAAAVPALTMTPAQWSVQLAPLLPSGDAVPDVHTVFEGIDPTAPIPASAFWASMGPAIQAAYAIPGDFYPGIDTPAEQVAMGDPVTFAAGSAGDPAAITLTPDGGISTPVPMDNLVTEEAAATLPYSSTQTPQQWVASLYTNLLASAGTSASAVPALTMTPAQWSVQLAPLMPSGDAVPDVHTVFQGTDPTAPIPASAFWACMGPAIQAAYAIPGDFYPGIVTPAEQVAMGETVTTLTPRSAGDPDAITLTAQGRLVTATPIANVVAQEAAATLPYNPSTVTPQQWVASVYTNLLASAGTSASAVPALEMTPAQWSVQLAPLLPSGDVAPDVHTVFRGTDPTVPIPASMFWASMGPAIQAAYAIPGDFYPGIDTLAEQVAMGSSGTTAA